MLAASLLGVSRAWVLARPEAVLTPEQERALPGGRRPPERGEPLHTSSRPLGGSGMQFAVSPAVLIHAAETEHTW